MNANSLPAVIEDAIEELVVVAGDTGDTSLTTEDRKQRLRIRIAQMADDQYNQGREDEHREGI